ncbi:MAG: hypothetical protein COA47_10270 [Robiginitomaculum sp.]|nr:MAG: hypothetical protein COA47_10270 [Robiginitomaculum sp.]
MSLLKKLAVDHPYYCNDSNYTCIESSKSWATMTGFLDSYEDCDIDMNLIFRWDVEKDTDAVGGYRAEVFIMHQRKGNFAPHSIASISEDEVERFQALMLRHWAVMKQIWEPLS